MDNLDKPRTAGQFVPDIMPQLQSNVHTVVKKSQNGIVNLTKLTFNELKDMLERQNKLLNNRRFLNSLPDKGVKIKAFQSKINNELKSRETIDEASALLSQLHLKNLPNEIEWTGKQALVHDEPLDSDDDSVEVSNPLQILANHSGTQKSYLRIREPATKPLVTKQDLEDAESLSSSSSSLSYAQNLCRKYDGKSAHERFKLNQPKQKELANTDFKSSSEKVKKRLGKNWEITSATPPVPIHGSTEMVSLADSLSIQSQQVQRLKEIQFKDAVDKLRGVSVGVGIGPLPINNLMAYRTPINAADIFEETPVRERNDEKSEDEEIP